MTRERYLRLHSFFEGHKGWAKALNASCGLLTLAVYAFFAFLVALEAVLVDIMSACEIMIVCGVGFAACTILRKIINSPRPYELYSTPSTIKRNKLGCSFPSRHVFSIAIISVATLRVNTVLGIVLAALTLILAAMRVIGGVHFIKDVVGGILIAALWGAGGFFIIDIIR